MTKLTKRVNYRRKRAGKTHYKKRLLLVQSGKQRLVVRKSLKNIVAQVVEYQQTGDKVLATASSRELIKMGWGYSRSNIPAAYLLGLLLAKKVKEKVSGSVILDLGLQRSVSGSKIYACVKGLVEGGITVECDDAVFPSDDRIQGKHIATYAETIKGDQEQYKKQFSGYTKNNNDPANLAKAVEEVKQKLI